MSVHRAQRVRSSGGDHDHVTRSRGDDGEQPTARVDQSFGIVDGDEHALAGADRLDRRDDRGLVSDVGHP